MPFDSTPNSGATVRVQDAHDGGHVLDVRPLVHHRQRGHEALELLAAQLAQLQVVDLVEADLGVSRCSQERSSRVPSRQWLSSGQIRNSIKSCRCRTTGAARPHRFLYRHRTAMRRRGRSRGSGRCRWRGASCTGSSACASPPSPRKARRAGNLLYQTILTLLST